MGQTFAEKILSKYSGRTVVPGEIVEVKPDIAMSHDNTAAISVTFEQLGVDKLDDPDRHVKCSTIARRPRTRSLP